MAVAARPVKRAPLSATRAATRGIVRMRRASQVVAGSYVYEGAALASGWHSHELHQLEYAVEGLVEVETAAGRHLLPPQQAAWIPAGVEHQSILHTSIRTVSVFFEPGLVDDDEGRVRVLAVAPLVRELLLHARRWPIGRSDDDPVADRFFVAMADVVRDALESERPLMLPTSPHPVVVAIADHVRRHIDTVTVTSLARAVGVSERTLRRLCRAELGVTCRDYLLQARLLQAMVLLAQPDSTVLGAATAVGFSSGSAFARVFAQRCGEAPAAYARRTRGATSLANRST